MYRSFGNVSLLGLGMTKMMTYVDISSAGCIRQFFDAYVIIVEGEFGLEAEQLCGFEQREGTCSLGVQSRGWEKSTPEELLDSSPMMTDRRAATECKVHDVYPIGVDDG